jgi:hypothetical protein
MNNKASPERYGKLSISSLVIGILALVCMTSIFATYVNRNQSSMLWVICFNYYRLLNTIYLFTF